MYVRNYPKTCAYCGKDFLGFKKKSKYCSDTCRYAWQARNQSEQAKERRQKYQKKWGQENWKRRRDYMILYTFGINSEQYEQLLKKQNHSCAVCKRHETEFSKKLAIDHDHKTGEIFGLLCQSCNRVLIGKHRDPKLFIAAAKYLKKGTGWIVPVKKRKKRRKKHVRKVRV